MRFLLLVKMKIHSTKYSIPQTRSDLPEKTGIKGAREKTHSPECSDPKVKNNEIFENFSKTGASLIKRNALYLPYLR